jgi:invasion protein IalB
MRRISLIPAIAIFGVFATATQADTMAHCSAAWNDMPAAAKAKTSYQDWSATCLKSDYHVGDTTAASGAPAGATGQCKDGTYTMSKTRSGACSHHGGIAKSL